MKIVIEDKFLKIIDKEILRSGNVNSYKMSIEYDSFYNDRVLIIYFKHDDIKKIVNVGPDNIIDIPHEVLESVGDVCVGFYSPSPDGDKLKDRYCSNFARLTVIEGAYDKDATPTEELTPTILEKYLQEMKNFYNESLEGYNNNANEKTEEFNKNYENKKAEIDKVAEVVSKDKSAVEEMKKSVETSEGNAKKSEQSAQNSAKKASESESNIISIEKNINDLKKDIDNTKTQIDEKAKEVKNNSDIAIEQARIATQQATLSGQNANKTSVDKEDISQMKVSIEASEDNIEEIEKNVQAIKDDIEAAKNETLEAKEEVENSLENERIENDKKYARALKTKVEDVEQTQIYAENSKVEGLKIKGAQLTQNVTEQSENIILLEDYPTTNNHGIDVTIKDNKITLNGTATAAFNLRLPIKYIAKESITGDLCLGYITSGDLSAGNGNIQIYEKNGNDISIYFPKNANPLGSYNYKVADNFQVNGINLYLNEKVVADNLTIDFTLANVASLDASIPFTPNSPSLDFPSEIKVIDEQKILICRKNLIKSFKFDDSNLDNYGWILRIEAPIKPNTTYTIGIKCSKDNKYYLSEEWIVGGGTNFTVTMTGNMQYITFTTKSEFNKAAYNSSQGGYILLKNRINQPNAHIFEDIILVEGTVNEAYQPYEGQDISIPLVNSAIGDYSDVIDKDTGIQNKLIQELVLTGDEKWYKSGENNITQSFQLNLNYSVENYSGLCNYLKTGIPGEVEKFSPLGTSLYIAINKTIVSTVDEFKALLAQLYQSGNPMKFYLIRKSASKESLPKEVKDELDKFKLYDNLNNVFIDNGTLSFKYNKSLLRAFEEQSELSAILLERIQALEAAQVNSVGGN